MTRYNIHWEEQCNVEVEASDKEAANDIWVNQDYDESEVSRDYVGTNLITVVRQTN